MNIPKHSNLTKNLASNNAIVFTLH